MDKDFKVFEDKNVRYNGHSSTLLNVEQGEAISTVLDKLVIGLSNLIERVNGCSFCEGEDNILSLSAENVVATSNTSQNTTIVSGAPANIKTIPNQTGVGVSYDLNNVVSSLGSNATIIKSKTVISGQKNGFPANIVTSEKLNASVNLRPDNFPATLESELRYQTPSGEKTISLKVPISSTNSEINLPMQGSLTGVPVINSQEDLNNNIQERLLNMENALNTLNNVNISGFDSNLPTNSNVLQAISYMLSEIESIKGQLP